VKEGHLACKEVPPWQSRCDCAKDGFKNFRLFLGSAKVNKNENNWVKGLIRFTLSMVYVNIEVE